MDYNNHEQLELYFKALEVLEKEIKVSEVFEKVCQKASLFELKEILKDISVVLCVDCCGAYEYFKSPSNPDFPRDVLNPYSFDFLCFKLRLKSFLLKQIYLIQGHENGLQAYIESKIALETPLPAITSVKTEVQAEKPAEKVLIEPCSAIGPLGPNKSLMNSIISEFSEEIRCVFSIYCENELIDIRNAVSVLNEMVCIGIINLSTNELQRFQRLGHILHPATRIQDYYYKLLDPEHLVELERLGIDYKTLYPKICIQQFIGLLDFFLKTLQMDAIQQLIVEDIKYYKAKYAESPAKTVKNTLKSLYCAYKDYTDSKNYFKVTEKENKLIKQLYEAYNQPMSLKVFLDFLQDYEIIGSPFTCYRFIKRKQAKAVYTRLCLNAMSLSQFTVKNIQVALNTLAGLYFTDEYDKIYGVSYSNAQSYQKTKYFYEILYFTNYKTYKL
jgi:hypothetical protein